MLSWILILLLQHPRYLEKLRKELEEQLSDRPITKDDIDRLPYLVACVRETLRLHPGAIGHTLKVREEAVSGPDAANGLGEEQYLVSRTDAIRVNLLAIQRDPLIWGSDAEQFKPERMLEDNFKTLPRNSWKVSPWRSVLLFPDQPEITDRRARQPFGNGVRICIGRFFALQEAHIAIATLVREFDFTLLNQDVHYRIGETVILQPVGCEMRVTRRRRSR